MKAIESKTLTLESVAKHFEEWRSNKKPGERIPERLWSVSVALLSDYSLNRIARTLHLCAKDLRKHRDALAAQSNLRSPASEMTFVEIDQPLVGAAAAPTAWLELQRPDGLRLRIQPATGADVLARLTCFMEV